MCLGIAKRRSSSLLNSEQFKNITKDIQTLVNNDSFETFDTRSLPKIINCQHLDAEPKQPLITATTNIKEQPPFDDCDVSVVSKHSTQDSTLTKSTTPSLGEVNIVTCSDVSMSSSKGSISKQNISHKAKKKYVRKPKKLRPGLTGTNRKRVFVEHNYHDHANDSEIEYVQCEQNVQGLKKKRANAGGVTIPFPEKLHTLLAKLSEHGLDSIISWQPHGRAFAIHNKKRFIEEVMLKYFKQTQFSSFLRQLNLYGFVRLSSGRDKGAYYHELFLRGKMFLCKRMVRIKCKGTGLKKAGDPDKEPDFFSMPFVEDCVIDQYKDNIQSTSGIPVLENSTASIPSTDSLCGSLDSSLDHNNRSHINFQTPYVPKTVFIKQSRNNLPSVDTLHLQDRRISLDGSVIDDMIVETLLLGADSNGNRETADFSQVNETSYDDSYKLNLASMDYNGSDELVNKVPIEPYSMDLYVDKNNEKMCSFSSETTISSLFNKARINRRASSKSFVFDDTFDEFTKIGETDLDDDNELMSCLEILIN